MNNSIFTSRRMYRLFRDSGRSVVIALDHGMGSNVYPALANPAPVLEAIIAGGADAILTSPGVIRQFRDHLKSVGVIMRVDGGNSTVKGGSPDMRLLYSVEDALRLGADGVICMGFPGTVLESQTLGNLAQLANQCQSWGVPLMAEMLPGGFMNPDLGTPENIRLAVRLAVELGADIIKTSFTAPAESFRGVVENCYRPVLVLGGGVVDELSLLKMVESAIAAGAAGVVLGRNIWNHPNPRAIVEAVTRIVHESASAEDALEQLASGRPSRK
jgi:DhnA family fructose-bisphosphate aldolase class Ia